LVGIASLDHFACSQLQQPCDGERSASSIGIVPAEVRHVATRTSAQTQGVSGTYWRASDVIGRKMIELKVDAAVAQINGKQ